MTDILFVLAAPGEAAHPGSASACDEWVRGEGSSAWPWSIERITYSATAATDGDARHLTADTEPTGHLVTGWDIVPMITDVPLLHICRPHTRNGEVAILAAKALGKSIVLSDLDVSTSLVGSSFGITQLADCLICRSDAEARDYSDHRRVVVLDPTSKSSPATLRDIYQDLLAGGENPA